LKKESFGAFLGARPVSSRHRRNTARR
jgi:hypothetical protein